MRQSKALKQAISALYPNGAFIQITPIIFNIINFYDDELLSHHISSKLNDDEKLQLLADSYLHELFSVEKRLLIEALDTPQETFYFKYSKLFPSRNNSNLIYVDFYKNDLNTVTIYHLGEYYIPILFKFDKDQHFYSTLQANQKDQAWISRMTGDPFLLARDADRLEARTSDEDQSKATCFNMHLSPGHYIEDELPAIYKLSKYLSESSTLKLYFTKGLGLDPPVALDQRVTRVHDRRDLIAEFNARCHWFIPNITRDIGREPEPIEFSHLGHMPSCRLIHSNNDPIQFAFGVRLNPRDGKSFRFAPRSLRALCSLLTRYYFQRTGKKVAFRPVIDFSIKDHDSHQLNLSRLAAEAAFLLECQQEFHEKIASTLNFDLMDKIKLLKCTAFGIYPHGSGGSPYVGFLNDRPIFVHNHDPIPLTDGYFDRMFPVLKNNSIIFNKNNILSLRKFTRVEDTSWTLDLSGGLVDFILDILESQSR